MTDILRLIICLGILAIRGNAFNAGDPPPNIASHSYTHSNIEEGLSAVSSSFYTKELIRRAYFGNFLRDFSQIMDRSALSLMSRKRWMPVVKWFGRQEFGNDTMFEIQESILGSYYPYEHIDNPKAYDGTGSHETDEQLRSTVRVEEYGIDMETGMKNYIANRGKGFNTSIEYFEKSLKKAVHFSQRDLKKETGRSGWFGRSKSRQASPSNFLSVTSMIYLGQALHVLEDFYAHSNFVELALRKLGYKDIFPWVGLKSQVRLNNGMTVYPLTTGTFGPYDFRVSLIQKYKDGASASNHQKNFRVHKSSEMKPLRVNLKELLSKDGEYKYYQSDEVDVADVRPERQPPSRLRRGFRGSRRERNRLLDESEDPGQGGESELTGSNHNQFVENEAEGGQFEDPRLRSDGSGPNQRRQKLWKRGLLSSLGNFLKNKVAQPVKNGITGVWLSALSKLAKSQTTPGRNTFFLDETNTDPSHSLISKDHYDNPLNEIAGRCAQFAVMVVGYLFMEVVLGKRPVEDLIIGAEQFFVHPDLIEQNNKVLMAQMDLIKSWAIERRDLLPYLTYERAKSGTSSIF